MSKANEKQVRAWDSWVGGLSKSAREALRDKETAPLPVEMPSPVGDEVDAYAGFRRTLTGAAKEGIDHLVEAEPTIEARTDQEAVRYALFEALDGDWPVTRVFTGPDGLARRIGQLEGQDIVVMAYFGVPLKLTMGPQRYLHLPDGRSAIMIPLVPGGPATIIDADLIANLEPQVDGFLGPPELAETAMPRVHEDSPRERVSSRGRDDDDVDDDDDEDDEDDRSPADR